jgi:hypothetical protein
VQAGEQLVRVNQDTRLNYRVLDFRTSANQGIFRIQCQVCNVSSFLFSNLFFCDGKDIYFCIFIIRSSLGVVGLIKFSSLSVVQILGLNV